MTTPDKPFDKISEATREEERLTRTRLRGGNLDRAACRVRQTLQTMTPQYEKNTPKEGEFDGHPA